MAPMPSPARPTSLKTPGIKPTCGMLPPLFTGCPNSTSRGGRLRDDPLERLADDLAHFFDGLILAQGCRHFDQTGIVQLLHPQAGALRLLVVHRSEERRVGKECRSRWS